MSPANPETPNLSSAELAVLAELLESERARLAIAIRHTADPALRDVLWRKLGLLEGLSVRWAPPAPTGPTPVSPEGADVYWEGPPSGGAPPSS